LIVHLEEIGKRVETAVTSDGRDVELAVASTKAFYAQIAAGSLLVWHWGAW
jgi:glucosamine--fructose-6-phosphate aminotransferase (isomerizing)